MDYSCNEIANTPTLCFIFEPLVKMKDLTMSYRLSNFDWDDLKFFLAVARAGTLRGGAVSLDANHATVSRRLSALEHAISARLFDRSKDGLQLTQLGEELLPHAMRVEEEIATASRAVAGQDDRPTGIISLSMPPFLVFSSIAHDLAEFSKQYEDIDLHIQTSNRFVDLGRREADVSLRIAFEITDDVVGRKLLTYSKAVYCSESYATQIEDNDGAGLHWIGWNENEADKTAPWIIKSPYPNATLRHRVNDGLPQMALAAAGVGLTYSPCFMADSYPGLVRAPFQTPVPDRSIWLLLHNDLRNTARIRLFVDFLSEKIRKRRTKFTAGLV